MDEPQAAYKMMHTIIRPRRSMITIIRSRCGQYRNTTPHKRIIARSNVRSRHRRARSHVQPTIAHSTRANVRAQCIMIPKCVGHTLLSGSTCNNMTWTTHQTQRRACHCIGKVCKSHQKRQQKYPHTQSEQEHQHHFRQATHAIKIPAT